MSNKPRGPFNGMQAAPPKMKPIQIDLAQLASFHCPGEKLDGRKCMNSAFNPVFQMLEVPALLANTSDGKPGLLRREMWLCVTCGGIWGIEQLVKVDSKEREAVRVEMEMRHIGRQEEPS